MNAPWKLPGSVSLAGCAAAVVALSCATPFEKAYAQQALRDNLDAYELQVLIEGGEAPRFFHAGASYILGQMGQRYTLRIWNRSHQRVEAVVSVDGRDVVDGRPGDFRNKRGYLVPAAGFVDIDGWRVSEREAAAFRFTTVGDSYAGRMGSARNVGVIGVAIFPERIHFSHRPTLPRPRQDSDRHAPERGRAPSAAAEGSGTAGSAPSAPPVARSEPAPDQRPGLGTEFGESVHSAIQEVWFVRENPQHPRAILGLRYNDRPGLLARGIDVDGRFGAPGEEWLRGTADPFPVSHRRYARPPGTWQP